MKNINKVKRWFIEKTVLGLINKRKSAIRHFIIKLQNIKDNAKFLK